MAAAVLVAVIVGVVVVTTRQEAGGGPGGAATPAASGSALDELPAAERAQLEAFADEAGIPRAQLEATFSKQRSLARATDAKARIKQVVNAVESCAAANVDGTYTGCDADGAAAVEPAIGEALAACGSPDGACLELAPDRLGYTITTTTTEPPVTFTESHGGDGTITKSCAPSGGPTCADGRW